MQLHKQHNYMYNYWNVCTMPNVQTLDWWSICW